MRRDETHILINLCLLISELKKNILTQFDETSRGNWFSWLVG